MSHLVGLLGGTGRLGPGLALRFALAGTPVLIGSRDAERGVAAAAEVAGRVAAAGGGASVEGGSNLEVALRCEVAMITIPHDGQATLLPELADALRDRVVVSTAVPVRFDRATGPAWDAQTSFGCAALEAQALLPGSRVVAGFHSLSSAILARPEAGVDSHVVVTGDDAAAKAVAVELAELLPGVRGVDGGPLRYALQSEQLTVLLLSINRIHKRHCGVVITDLPGA